MTKPDEDNSASEPTSGEPGDHPSAERPVLTTDDEAQSDDPVIDPGNS
ncbi:MAG: hypothetical protein ACR2KO_13840 [Geodermatophilaceae bacterium]|jgi:hypothetical protein